MSSVIPPSHAAHPPRSGRPRPAVAEEGAARSTISGHEIAPLYTEADLAGESAEKVGAPGAYPFTRGPYPSMYR
ncbi:MAG TPA: methylmalonyl-CoA mutase family protein, partial [Solirubrobacterales bacterium]|nr:methylmalonyl-CoA mutase family protein [Solirubrobacterales bacterium]